LCARPRWRCTWRSPLNQPRWFMYLFAAFVGFGTGGVVVIMYAIFPDVPDAGELRTGKRQEGTFSALTTFMRKLSSAFSLFLVGNFLNLTGYLPPVGGWFAMMWMRRKELL